MEKRVLKGIGILAGLMLLILVSCDPAKKYEREEKQRIQEYVSGLGDTVYVTKESGLVFIDLTPGTGRMPVAKDTVYIRYKGIFLNGHTFSTNMPDGDLLEFVVGNYELIDGLDEGVRYMKNGGTAKMLTPSWLAYGSLGWGIIPGFEPLLWVIEIVDVIPGSK